MTAAVCAPPRDHHMRDARRLERRYPSQLAFRPYGDVICTPTSLLAATAYVRGADDDPYLTLTPALVREMMAASHSLYEHCFAKGGARPQLMVQDLMQFLPRDELHVLEVGGMLQRDAADDPGDVEALHVTSLERLLRDLDGARDVGRGAAVVTTAGHTTAYLFDRRRGTFHFDPAQAALRDLSGGAALADVCFRAAPEQEYAGVVLYARRGAAA